MFVSSIPHLLLVGAHGATSIASVYCVLPKARAGDDIPKWLVWPKLAIAVAIAVKIGTLAVESRTTSAAAWVFVFCTASIILYAISCLQPQKITSLRQSINSPFATHILALMSIFVDTLATSLSLTFVSTFLQCIISTLACTSMLCASWMILFPPSHSAIISRSSILSVQHPLISCYRFIMSIVCDNLLDAKPEEKSQQQDEEPDYLLEFNEFLFDRHKITLPLHSLLWTLRKPAIIATILSAIVAFIVCTQAILVYTALSLLTNRSYTSYMAFVHCTLSFGVMYYSMAVSIAKVRHFTTRFALKLRTSILSMIAEKVFRLSRSAVAETNLNSFLSTELQAFMECISGIPAGLSRVLEICGSIFGLTFIIGGFAYATLAFIIVYLGYMIYATNKTSYLEVSYAEKRKKRLAETHSIMQNLLSIKTLGLQSYYLAILQQLRSQENTARRKFREDTSALTMTMFLFYPICLLMVLCGLARRHLNQPTSAENVFPTLVVLFILGESIGKARLSIRALPDIRYLQRLMDLLNKEEVPLRFEDKMESNSRTQIRICNLTCEHASKSDSLFLKDVNIELFRGDFAFIYGRTGSGKTTFLQAILGEQMTSTGSVHVADASLAYCGQDTWLPNTSIQLCITGGNPVDETRYRTVVAACRLPAEMTSLAYSGSTKIGPNGCYLSRTDRAKLILARAAYAGAAIVLLDDSFAVFDMAEATELAHTLLNPVDGLLRVGKATVLLASHSFAVPTLIDDTYCLATSQFIVYPVPEETTDFENVSNRSEPLASTTTTTTGTLPRPHTMSIQDGRQCNHHDEAQRVSLQKNISFVWKAIVDRASWKKYILIILLFTFVEAPLVFGMFSWPQFRLSMPLSVLLQLVLSLVYYWTARHHLTMLDDLRLAFAKMSHKKISTLIMTSSPTRTFHLTSAELSNLLGTDLEVLDSSLYRVFQFTYNSAYLVFLLTLLFWSTNYSLTAVCSALVCVGVVEHTWSGTSKRASECSDHVTQKLNAKFAEVADGLPYIRGFGWEKNMLRQLLSVANETEAALGIVLSLEPWFEMTMSLCWTAMATTIVGYTFCHLDEVSPNKLGLALITILGFPALARDVLSISMEIKELLTGTDRIRKFMMASDDSSMAEIDPTAENEDWGSIPEIVFENAEIGSNPPLNGKIRGAGQVLVQGCNGSGKTSLLLALLGKGEYTGSIRVGGVEARDLSGDVIRSFVSIMPQDPVALPGTFEDNLFLTHYTDPKKELEPIDDFLTGILEKLDLVHLTEPEGEGFDNLVSEMRLSEGQIALLNLARCAIDVLGKQTRIVVVDDMFSKLDREYADIAKDFIEKAFKACIVVVAETTSVARISVKGLTPLNEEYADPDIFDPVQLAASDEEVRKFHRARHSDGDNPNVDGDNPNSHGDIPDGDGDNPNADGENPDEAPPAPGPNPPNPNDPWLEPRRPAPRPPRRYTVTSAMAEYTRDTRAPITRPSRRRRNANPEAATAVEGANAGDAATAEGANAAEAMTPATETIPEETATEEATPAEETADAANVGDPNTVDEPSDPNPDGSMTYGERVVIDALRGIPSERSRRRRESWRQWKRQQRARHPGGYPGGDDSDDDDDILKDRPPKPGTVEYQIQTFITRFMVGFALLMTVFMLLVIFWP